MNNVKKVIKASVLGVVASAMLCMPAGAQTPSRAALDGGIILQNPYLLYAYIDDVSLIYPEYRTQVKELPATLKNNVQSVKVVGATNIQAVIVNGTQIQFTSTTSAKAKATVYVTGGNGFYGYYNVTTESVK
ncbi:hypothetical protein [Paenibacillus rigui]|uniref:Uncharacterized protein n=1 Tax=Paenibacillus rigui TaxID=554312 RepID=A0A229UPZ5_9BACL|nr:hypothetical protein [Paenibacillus rigui]OXM85430.1 hypothetical protein CF651_15585 [Paenibacillus rigui]